MSKILNKKKDMEKISGFKEWIIKPANMILSFHAIFSLCVVIYFIVLLARMSEKFCLDCWEGWAAFTYILVIVWVATLVIHYLGRTKVFNVKSWFYRILSFASFVVLVILTFSYCIPIKSKYMELSESVFKNIRDHYEDVPKDFTDPLVIQHWVDARTYHAGVDTLVMMIIWFVIDGIYIVHLLLCYDNAEYDKI